MDLNKFTERARGVVQAAQTIAMREGHQRLLPEHLLKALMDDDQGLASNLIKRAGGAPERVAEAVDLALSKLPSVSGDAGQIYMDGQTAKVLDEAEIGLVAGEQLPIGLLIDTMIVRSANDAAVAVAEAVGGDVETFVGVGLPGLRHPGQRPGQGQRAQHSRAQQPGQDRIAPPERDEERRGQQRQRPDLGGHLGAVVEAAWDRIGRTDDPPMTRFLAEQLSTAHWFDQRETRRSLEWVPRVRLEEGFERLRAWFAAQTDQGRF